MNEKFGKEPKYAAKAYFPIGLMASVRCAFGIKWHKMGKCALHRALTQPLTCSRIFKDMRP